MNRFLASFLLVGFGCAALPALGTPASAQNAPRSMAECERLKNDLAYNQCLAMFGPAAKNVGGGGGGSDGGSASSSVATALAAVPPVSTESLPMADEPAQETRKGQRGRRGRYTRQGRQSASFTIGGSESRSSYRRRRRH
ncbi:MULTISPECIES: hypothetical protein [unclassified Methylobacterium]|uniref:hypothetical protein n=1 Tax=unclassified Methylobacterium TaxID=2615210 RepID=UPI0006FC8D64|nr:MULTISPECIES: hypothetical protein [unclassified Methylobacterium]KQO53698.1 hypothetical protein ASF24_05010 [Methylobacterium sp. Leaf86]KQO99230.1 hypothetical protein ASF32_15385 [Methylobacterium sp. Leaf91]